MSVQRVLVVLEAGDRSPSGLVRGLVYDEEFKRRGIEVKYVSRLDPSIEKLTRGKGVVAKGLGLMGMTRRLQAIGRKLAPLREEHIARLSREFDVVYLLKTDSFTLLERIRRESKARIVFDLNDALWLPRFTGFAQGKLHDVLREVDAIVSDNEYGLEYARTYNEHLYMVPEHPQLEAFERMRGSVTRSDSPVIGWVGSPATAYNLFSIWEPLERLFRKHSDLTLRLVGVGGGYVLPPFENVRYSFVSSYDQAQMVDEVLKMHIGLYPLFDVQDSWARGIMKATIYMCGGAVPIAPRIGACPRLIQDGVNGMLASTPEEWLAKLEHLVEATGDRQRMSERALAEMRETRTLALSFERLYRALEGA